ncbi:MAG: DNA-3-methyladenine glycosylase I [Acidimicrobiia bacterium]|nr:DNA-3-methyladenine glycosylase I [Acidimicrobiia bacterium]
MAAVTLGDEGRSRCSWATTAPDYIEYHDTEWGFPVGDDIRLFEKLCLEGFQSGLSWLTILRKRPAFRTAFHGFDPARVAAMTSADTERLLRDARIIRHRGKIEATIHNAGRALAVVAELGSLGALIWRFEEKDRDPGRPVSPRSVALARELKSRGFKWVGPTTMYAFMQAMGLVNDHWPDCFVYELARERRNSFVVPI